MRLRELVGCVLFSRLVVAAVTGDIDVFERLREVPEEWKAGEAPLPDTALNFRIALNSGKEKEFDQAFQDISTPGSAKYGQYLSKDELRKFLRPSAAGTESVLNWLKSSGVKDIRDEGEWIHFTASRQQADSMMNTKFLVYRNTLETSIQKIRTEEVSLPRNVIPFVKMIHPTTRFSQMTPQGSQIFSSRVVDLDNSIDPSCSSSSIKPSCLQDLYNIKGFTPDPKKGGFIGVAGFLSQYARFDDLAKFTAESAQWASTANFTWTSVNGGVLDQKFAGGSTEANLDIQYTVALTHPMRNNFYSTKGRGPLVTDLDQPTESGNQNEPYLEYFQFILNQTNKAEIPHTLSFSYGENEQSVPPSYAQTVCDQIKQLGARGVTVIFSSGDTGVGSACQTNDAQKKTRFLPTFPGACPYVLSVGGTVGLKPERAVSFSSGGFSDLWPRPWYQNTTVPSYLQKLGDRWNGLYNPNGRGFPDIAAQGVGFRVYDQGRVKGISGTSASAPVIAGIMALLNAKQIQEGKPALGFANPWLYSLDANVHTDIVEGGSTGCTGRDTYSGLPTPYVANASWAAVIGWDPVTGLGTPKFDQLMKNLPAGGASSSGKPA